MQFCPLTSTRFGHLAIEHRSDRGVADQIAVGDKEQSSRYEADDGEFEKARKRPIRNPNLHDLDKWEVSNVEPVGRIRNKADLRTLPRREFTENPDEPEDHKPDEKRGAKGNDFVAKLQVCPLHKAQRGQEDQH